MGLAKQKIKKFQKELESSLRPLFFFDDDPDGLCSFIQLFRSTNEGKGVVLKTRPRLDESFVRKVDEFSPDKVFILDIPEVSDEFIEQVKVPIVWLDHHGVNKKPGIKYFNPMDSDEPDNRPTSYWAYKITGGPLWLAMCGCVGDWFIPDFADEFLEKFPDLFSDKITEPDEALFNSKIGELAKILSFVLKGKTSDANTVIKIMTRIQDPYEILSQTTSQGKYIFKRFQKINKTYDELMDSVKATEDPILIFNYDDSKMSFTSEISNELLYKYPDKVIIVGRDRNGEIKMSLRGKDIEILPKLNKALVGLTGYGGGHLHACGACVKKEEFNEFVDRIRKQL